MSDMSDCELSVLIPTYGRAEKLRALLQDIAATTADHEAFEVIVVVDDLDDAPLEASSTLPRSIRFSGLTQPHKGPAAARNSAVQYARGRWLLFYDDDARVDPRTIPGHLRQIRADPNADVAHLGRVDWPPELLNSPWRILLAESSMLFFWDQMTSGKTYGFRHFWTSNLSVRADAVRAVGGFREQFHKNHDIELGWRLQQRFGMRVRVDKSINSWHVHPIDPEGYFRREHDYAQAAESTRLLNPDFHAEVWSWIGQPETTLETLRRLFTPAAKRVRALFEEWAVPSDHRPTSNELRAAYLAHLPLKRMAFCQGYLHRPFEELWDAVQP